MAKKRRPPFARNIRTYTVYIIELSRDSVVEPCALAPLYVGQTAHDPKTRFAQHKAGGGIGSISACRKAT